MKIRLKKYGLWLALILMSGILFYSCQRDDLCAASTPVTPQLILRFFDIDNPGDFKTVNSLRVFGENMETIIIDRSTTDSIAIPLRSFEDMTTFFMIIDSASDDMGMETGNLDTLRFNYETQEIFISRACGFIANFDNLSDDLEADTDNWIQAISVTSTTIENENQAHVQIFH